MKNNLQYLGSLSVMKYFNYNGKKYRTITYPPSNTTPTYGTRWCLNMDTLKAEFLFCRAKIEPVKDNTSLKELNERIE